MTSLSYTKFLCTFLFFFHICVCLLWKSSNIHTSRRNSSLNPLYLSTDSMIKIYDFLSFYYFWFLLKNFKAIPDTVSFDPYIISAWTLKILIKISKRFDFLFQIQEESHLELILGMSLFLLVVTCFRGGCHVSPLVVLCCVIIGAFLLHL